MPWFWFGIVPLGFIVFTCIAYRRAKVKKKTKKIAARRDDLRKGIVLVIFTLAVSTAMTADVVKDINNRSFLTVHEDFEKRRSSGGRSLIGYGYYIVTTDDGEEFRLRMPPMISPYEKPDLPKSGTHHGTIWYSENSRYALKFIPDTD